MTQAVSSLSYPKFHAQDSTGAPLVGGKVYTYSPGTTTPKTSYSNAALSTPNANPVILDANGDAVIYLNGLYDIALTDANDVAYWTMSNVYGTISAINEETVGFTISGGTTSKTLTVPLDATVSGTNTGDMAVTFSTNTSRNMTTASGDVAYTGAGFQPTCVFVLAGLNDATYNAASVGMSGGVSKTGCIRTYAASGVGDSVPSTNLVFLIGENGATQTAVVKSFDDDGMTLTWTLTGTPVSETITMHILYIK